jgi:nitrile hydratase accessory protein
LSAPEPRLPPGVDEPVFAEPWQAQAFAMTVSLHAAGLFSWSEWAAALSSELKGEAADGHDYYEHWLAALEALVRQKGVADAATIEALTAAWHRAAEATPHGKPILLENDPNREFV